MRKEGSAISAVADGPELTTAKRPGPDGPLFTRRETIEFRDEIYLGGFGDSCHATRASKSSLIVPSELPVTERVTGDALTVLHTVVSDWPPT